MLLSAVSVASYISQTSEAIAIKLDALTAPVTKMHHVFSISTLTFTQGHADLNRKNNKCSIISETVQAMVPIKFAVEIVRLKVYIILSQSDDLALHARSQLRLKRDTFLTVS